MPRLTIDARGKPLEVTDRYRIGGDANAYEQMGRYYIDPSTRKVETIWERVVGYIFTASGRPLISASGRMLCLKHQLEK